MQVLTRAPYVRVYTREGVHTHVSTPAHSAFHQDERDQVLTLYLWIRQEWTDAYLRWDPDAYGGLDAIRIPSSLVWRPDIVLYNKYCLPPPPPELPLALGVHALPIPTGDLAAAVPSQLPHRIFLRGQGGVGRFGNCR